MSQTAIRDIGISVVYEPSSGEPIVDIIIVHGLQGHPYKTWACRSPQKGGHSTPLQVDTSVESKDRPVSLRRGISRLSSKLSRRPSKVPVEEPYKTSVSLSTGPYWPRDFLPADFPDARVMVFGYDTKVSKYMSGATNKNGVYQHSKDLLSAIHGSRRWISEWKRPLIFIAHSLGGIIVKEMLARSSVAGKNEGHIIDATRSVIFLGTPHRGSPDLASLGESARMLISAMRFETNSAILDVLGLRTTDLERAQDAFSDLWNKYRFQVKTFREGLGLTSINFGVLGNKVVPDYSSLIGDPRERAETIQANHMDMCRFGDCDDPGYKQLAREIEQIYHLCVSHGSNTFYTNPVTLPHRPAKTQPENAQTQVLTPKETAQLEALPFHGMNSRFRSIDDPARGTCEWLFEHPAYSPWFHGHHESQGSGLLWLKGQPGGGKSTLIREAFARALRCQETSDYWLAAFFFNAKGGELEHSPLGLYRSLLHQLLPHCLSVFKDFSKTESLVLAPSLNPDEHYTWHQGDCEKLLRSVLLTRHHKRIVIFIDAIDECESNGIESLVEFWRDVTVSAHIANLKLSVCLTSRRFPNVSISNCMEIDVEKHNSQDIARYINRRLSLRMDAGNSEVKKFESRLLARSAGSFLWVVLVLDDLLRGYDRGQSISQLLQKFETVPRELQNLYTQLLEDVDPVDGLMTLRLFEWVVLAAKPLRLHEWHHVEAFLEDPPPSSLRSARNFIDNHEEHEYVSYNDERLVKRLTNLSKGLVGVTAASSEPQECESDTLSVHAGAGSLDLEHGETRFVQVIHESVRDFFLHDQGFLILAPGSSSTPDYAVARGHLALANTCLDYINIKELDALVQARFKANHRLESQTKSGDRMSSDEEPATLDRNDVKQDDAKLQSLFDFRSEHADPGFRGMASASDPMLPLHTIDREMSLQDTSGLYGSFPRFDDDSFDWLTGFGNQDMHATLQRSPSVASFGSAGSYNGEASWTPKLKATTPQGRSDKQSLAFFDPQYFGSGTGDLKDLLSKPSSPGIIEGIDVDRWRLEGPSSPKTSLPQPSKRASLDSFSGSSQVLEIFPSLLSYTTAFLFYHCRQVVRCAATGNGPESTAFLQKLEAVWTRWKLLEEKVPFGTHLLYHLVKQGIEPWAHQLSSSEKQSPAEDLLEAAKQGDRDAFDSLLKSIGYHRSYEDPSHGPILHALVKMQDAIFLRQFCQQASLWNVHHADPSRQLPFMDGRDLKGRSPLQLAVLKNDKASAAELLRWGANVNAYNGDGRTALQTACFNVASTRAKKVANVPNGASCGMVKLLLDCGADVTMREGNSRTALHGICCNSPPAKPPGSETQIAAVSKHCRACPLLDPRSCAPTTGGHDGTKWTSQENDEHELCKSKIHVIVALLDRGADVNALGPAKETPLHMAAFWQEEEVIHELLRRGANPRARDYRMRTPLHHASWFSDFGTVRTLVLSRNAADIDCQDHLGWTPLQMACHSQSNQNKGNRGEAIIRLLLEKGANPFTLFNSQGHTAYNIAIGSGNSHGILLMGRHLDIVA